MKLKHDTKRANILKLRKARQDFSENILMELNCEHLGLLYMRAKKDITDFLDLFNLEPTDHIGNSLLQPDGDHPMKTVFQEICFINRIKADQV